MTIIDFKEIAQANKATGLQDEFELFCSDFLSYLGYTIVSGPDRGQDGGIDLLAEDTRTGVSGSSTFRWLVSCKHYAHSKNGKSVGVDDEVNISDRVKSNGCHGFIGIYSTIPSSGLTNKLQGLLDNSGIDYKIFNRGSIEDALSKKESGLNLAKRYFPISIKTWLESNTINDGKFIVYSNSESSTVRQKFYDEYIHRKRKEKN